MRALHSSPHLTTTNVIAMQNESVSTVLTCVKDLLDEKSAEYLEEPAYIVPIDDLLAQIHLKSLRAQQAAYHERVVDELKDVIAYSAIAITRMMNEHGVKL